MTSRATGQRLLVVLLLLLVATLFSFFVGHGEAFLDRRAAGTVIIAVAWFKARLIMRDFMEVRLAPTRLRIGGELWLATLSTALIAMCLWG